MPLNYYVENNIGEIVFSLLVIIALSIFLLTLKRKLSNENELRPDFAGQLVFRYPFCSAIFIGLNLLQFLFQDTPFIFSMIILDPVCLLSYDNILGIYHEVLEKVLAYGEFAFSAGMYQ